MLELKPNTDPRAWAKKIILRHDRGETLPAIAIEWAREALNLPAFRDRQPGEDDTD
jgi:hypothetical protein